MKGRVGYGLGAKAPSLTCDSSQITAIDCSGFVRYAAAKASGQGFIMPDGSATQHEWCAAQGFEKADYRAAGSQANPAKLFIAFITPETSPDGVGHVWFVHAGKTIESHGGHPSLPYRRGVDSRPWDFPTLLKEVGACYLLPSVE